MTIGKTRRRGWKRAFRMAGALLVMGMSACSLTAEKAPAASIAAPSQPYSIKKREQSAYFHNSEGNLDVSYPLSVQKADITIYDPADLEQLAKLTNLRDLHLDFMGVGQEDITLEPLRGMKKLETLNAGYTGITNLSPLAGLEHLRSLTLYGNHISDLSPLARLWNLEELLLHSNEISDLRPLQNLTNLRYLCLDDNPITDLTPLSGLSSHTSLSLGSLAIPWDGWTPVAHIQAVSGGPPRENAGKLPCPPEWIRRIEAAYPGSMIAALDYDDYDGDGISEAFAFLSPQSDNTQGWFHGKLLYLTNTCTQELTEGTSGMYVTGYYRFGNVKIIQAERQIAVTSSSSILWQVEEGKAREANLSGLGQEFHLDEYGNIRMMHSAYDGDSTGCGHSYKPYYFYFDGRDFVEYGAIQVSRQQFLTCGNAQAILDEAETDGWKVAEILYRGRGVIHLNLRKPLGLDRRQEERSANRYITLRREDNRLTVIDKNIGYYLPAMTTPINRPQRVPVVYPSGWVNEVN